LININYITIIIYYYYYYYIIFYYNKHINGLIKLMD